MDAECTGVKVRDLISLSSVFHLFPLNRFLYLPLVLCLLIRSAFYFLPFIYLYICYFKRKSHLSAMVNSCPILTCFNDP